MALWGGGRDTQGNALRHVTAGGPVPAAGGQAAPRHEGHRTDRAGGGGRPARRRGGETGPVQQKRGWRETAGKGGADQGQATRDTATSTGTTGSRWQIRLEDWISV